MESLNMYASDGESDSSTSLVPRKYAANSEEIDANCEPITMDMSEDSSNGHSDNGSGEQRDTNNTKRLYSKGSPTSPTSSYSSDSSDHNKRSKGRDEDSRTDSSKSKRYENDRRNDDRRSKCDKDYRHDDIDRDRRRQDDRRDRRRDRESDRYDAKKHDRKRYRSRSRSSSHGRRNSRSYRHKNKSRSRSRSYDRYQRKTSPNRNNSRRRSPYRSRRSRSKSRSRSRSPRDKPRPKNWKSTSKLKVLEKLGIELKVPPASVELPQTGSNPIVANTSSPLTPQMLLQKTMEEQVEKVKSATGIALPSYYNPMAVNPTKYAEQIQKRRLLWGNKDKSTNNPPPEEKKDNPAENKGTGTIWQGATFGGDQDGKMTAKFQRLMGIKNAAAAPVPETKKDGTDLIKKQEEMFNSMESQYEVARLATHTHRGVGLGFGTFQPR